VNHPRHWSWQEILDWVEKTVDPTRDAHLETCSECGKRVEMARRLLARVGHARLSAPPEHLLDSAWERVRDEWEARGAPGESRESPAERVRRGVRELWASLTADSLQPSLGVRGGSTTASPRMVRYETEDFAISISLSSDAASGAIAVRGQVVPLREGGLPPDGRFLVSEEGEEHEAAIDGFGEFQVSGLASGAKRAAIRIGDILIRFDLPA
jgi:hypothetical protein